MKVNTSKFFRLAALGAAGFAFIQSLTAADLLNGGFASKASWTGDFLAGNEGGNGWGTSYFGGTFPTDNTFASTVKGTVHQALSGSGNTFIEGVTYKISMSIFGASNWPSSTGSAIMWSLGFTADGTAVGRDHWFSDEFTASSVAAGNGGTIPNDHIVTIAPGSTGLRTVTFTYTATAADAGKVIGVQVGGKTQSRYTYATGAAVADDRYGMMDNVTFEMVGLPEITSFTSDADVIDGVPIRLMWEIGEADNLTTLTLDDGNGPVSVLNLTDLETGLGEKEVNPTQNTTYTLAANGVVLDTVTIYNGKIDSFTSDTVLAMGPDYEATLNWNVRPDAPTSVTISDGVNTVDVTADTLGGFGSRSFTVPTASTTFTLNLNNGSATKTVRVLRAVPANPDKFWINAETVYSGQSLTASWKDAGNANGSWVGVYKKGNLPGPVLSTQWSYINTLGGANGSRNFTGLAPGEYFAILFVDGEYTIEQGPVYFTVSGDLPPVETPPTITSFTRAGNICTIIWNSEADATYDLFATSDFSEWTLIQENIPSGGASTTATEDLGTLPNGIPSQRFYRLSR